MLELGGTGLPAGAAAVLGFSGQSADLPLGGGCTVWLDLSATQFLTGAPDTIWSLGVPAGFASERVYAQGFGIEILPGLGVLSSTAGLEIPFSTILSFGF